MHSCHTFVLALLKVKIIWRQLLFFYSFSVQLLHMACLCLILLAEGEKL